MCVALGRRSLAKVQPAIKGKNSQMGYNYRGIVSSQYFGADSEEPIRLI
jgi:hypothetical protein